jgi:hypothetical protein
MNLRSRKITREEAGFPDASQDTIFKRQFIRQNPASEPIPESAKMSSEPQAKTDVDIDDLRKQYANNPQALQALDEISLDGLFEEDSLS